MKLYAISCDPLCGFMIKSHDENEAVALSLQHAMANHKETNPTDQMLRSMVKEEGDN